MMEMSINIKPPESLAEGSDNFIPFQRMDELSVEFYQAMFGFHHCYLGILLFYLNVPNGTI